MVRELAEMLAGRLTTLATALVILASALGLPSPVYSQQLVHKKSVAAIAREVNGAVVSIVMSDKEGHPIAQGSGFFVTRDGRAVTNYHVIKSGASAIVKLPDGAFYEVDGVLAADESFDIAVIKVRGKGFHAVRVGDSDRLQG